MYLSSHDVTAGRAFSPLSISIDEVDEVDEDFVRKRVEEGNSHAVISEEITDDVSRTLGTQRTICLTFLYRQRHNSTLFSDKEELEHCVSDAVSEVSTKILAIYLHIQRSTVVSPAELLLGRRFKTRLDVVRPDITSHVTVKQVQQNNSMMRQHTNDIST